MVRDRWLYLQTDYLKSTPLDHVLSRADEYDIYKIF